MEPMMKTAPGRNPINRELALACLTILSVVAACAPRVATTPTAFAPLSFTDGLGHKITLESPARRVVSLAPSNTEILFAVGAGAQMIGRDSFSDYPAEAGNVPDIGGGFTALNTELILSKKPDLVLAAPLTPPEQIADLQNVGLPVFVVPNPKTFTELYANLQTVGRLTGHEADAATLIDALKGRVDAVARTLAGATQKPLIYYELDATDPNAPYTSGPGTFVALLIDEAGGTNFGANLNGEWVQVSVEELLAKQPDLIVLGDHTYGGVTPEQVASRTGWQALKAVQQQKVFIFDDNLVSRPGPRLVDGLEAMARLLHPELFK
jgi:iron complex transport system substrate-binding protein